MNTQTYKARAFENETVDLDGKKFVGCDFTACELVYAGGDLTLSGCVFDGCRWRFEGPASMTLAVLRSIKAMPGGDAIIAATFDDVETPESVEH